MSTSPSASQPCQAHTPGVSSSRAARRAEVETALGGLDFDVLAAAPTAQGLDQAAPAYALAYFFALDRQSHPSLIEGASTAGRQRRSDVLECSAVLVERLKLRYRALRERPARVPTGDELPRCSPGALRRLARWQEQLLGRWFPGSFHGFDTRRVLAAHELFATGQLTSGRFDRMANTWPGQPDGMNVFLFAEFALLAVDEGQSPRAWQRLATLFTVAEQLFAVAYGRSARSRAEGHDEDAPLTWQTRGPPALAPDQAPLIANEGWREWLRSTYLAPTSDPALIHAQVLLRACPGGFGNR